MKKILLLASLAFLYVNAVSAINVVSKKSAKIDTIYYDSNWKGVPTKTFATYMRLIYISNNPHYNNISKDYYISGELAGEGEYVYIDRYDDSKSKWKGAFVNYYKSGVKKNEGYNNESSLREGKLYEYYEDGKVSAISNFENGVLNNESKSFYENGNVKASIVYNKGIPQEYTTYYESGMIEEVMPFKDGKVNGTAYHYIENNEGHLEMEMINGTPKYKYEIAVGKNGNRFKMDINSGNFFQEAPTFADIQRTEINGNTILDYQMNGILVSTSVSINKTYGKYYKINLLVKNYTNESFILSTDKIECSILKNNEEIACKLLDSDEYLRIVKRKQGWQSFWNGLGESVAVMNAGNSSTTTTTNSTAMVSSTDGSTFAIGKNTTTTNSSNGTAQYLANQNAMQNIQAYDNILSQYSTALDQGYLKSNEIASGQTISGFVNVKYEKGEILKINIPINGFFYPFEWNIKN